MKTSMRPTRSVALAAATLALGLGLPMGAAQAQGTLLWSTQASPVAEQKAMREQVLKDAPIAVEFLSNQEGPFLTRLNAELQAGKGSIAVVGALHGTLATAGTQMVDLSAQAKGLSLSPAFVSLGKLGTGEQKYLPWMQATFVMAAHKKALPYLPAGADLQRLTYD